MDLSRLTTGDKVIVGAGALLVIDLIFVPWHYRTFGGYGRSYTDTSRAIAAPNGMWGWLAVALAIAIVTIVLVRRLSSVALPAAPRPHAELLYWSTMALMGVLIFKMVLDTADLGIGCYLSLVLSGTMVYGAYLDREEADDAPPTGTGKTPPTPF